MLKFKSLRKKQKHRKRLRCAAPGQIKARQRRAAKLRAANSGRVC